MKGVPVQGKEEQAAADLIFVEIDGRLILHQKWWVFEWGNKECVGIPMNERSEWRPVPTGAVPSRHHSTQGE